MPDANSDGLSWFMVANCGKESPNKSKHMVGSSETNLNGSFLFYIDTKEDCDTNTYRSVHLSNNNVGRCDE